MLRSFAPSATVVVGFAFKATSFYYICTLRSDGGSTEQLSLGMTMGNNLELRRGSPTAGTILGTSAGSLTIGVWHYIEIKATVADAGGTCEVRVDGVTQINFTGDTRNGGTSASVDVLRFNAISTAGGVRNIDDLYICDATGSANNDFLGDIKIETLYPNGNGTNSQLTGSDGNQVDNYLLVDEAGTPATADYVTSGTVGQKDTYAFSNLVTSTGPVKGVQINNYANKTDAGSRSIKALAVSGGSTATGAIKPLQTTYNAHLQVQETDPNGGGAWTIAAINNAEFGVEVDA